jgi:hypothetical protein
VSSISHSRVLPSWSCNTTDRHPEGVGPCQGVGRLGWARLGVWGPLWGRAWSAWLLLPAMRSLIQGNFAGAGQKAYALVGAAGPIAAAVGPLLGGSSGLAERGVTRTLTDQECRQYLRLRHCALRGERARAWAALTPGRGDAQGPRTGWRSGSPPEHRSAADERRPYKDRVGARRRYRLGTARCLRRARVLQPSPL